MSGQTVIILAGGRGLGMGSLTDKTQKCVLMADKKPILGYVLDSLYRAFESPRIIITTGWRSETVYDYVDRYHSEKNKIYFVNDARLAGTRHCILQVEYLCKAPFLIIPGNVVVPASALQALKDSFEHQGDATSTAHLLLAKQHRPTPSDWAVRVRGTHVTEMISPAPATLSRNIFWNTGIMYCPERFFYFLRCAPARFTHLADTIAFGLDHKQKFSFVGHKGRWRHFAVPADLAAKIKP